MTATAGALTPTGSGTPAPEIVRAGLSEAQRRTEAVLLLQEHEDVPDAEVLIILQEFEENMAAVDMYLALRTDRLRVGYVRALVARRGGM